MRLDQRRAHGRWSRRSRTPDARPHLAARRRSLRGVPAEARRRPATATRTRENPCGGRTSCYQHDPVEMRHDGGPSYTRATAIARPSRGRAGLAADARARAQRLLGALGAGGPGAASQARSAAPRTRTDVAVPGARGLGARRDEDARLHHGDRARLDKSLHPVHLRPFRISAPKSAVAAIAVRRRRRPLREARAVEPRMKPQCRAGRRRPTAHRGRGCATREIRVAAPVRRRSMVARGGSRRSRASGRGPHPRPRHVSWHAGRQPPPRANYVS